MMEKRLSRFGIGPMISGPAIVYTIAAWLVTSRWPGVFRMDWLPEAVRYAGVALIAIGLLIWFSGVVTVMAAYNRDRLVTTGVFGLVRHPVYAGWITLAFPGLALFCRSWPMLLTPFLSYAIFRCFIHREDEYLQRRFGQAYLDYCERVNEVIPIPRFQRERQ
ncbi:MAG: isoprenylcysteine carboxylmethyltransferase family protein [Bryobacteraceae bacterium]